MTSTDDFEQRTYKVTTADGNTFTYKGAVGDIQTSKTIRAFLRCEGGTVVNVDHIVSLSPIF